MLFCLGKLVFKLLNSGIRPTSRLRWFRELTYQDTVFLEAGILILLLFKKFRGCQVQLRLPLWVTWHNIRIDQFQPLFQKLVIKFQLAITINLRHNCLYLTTNSQIWGIDLKGLFKNLPRSCLQTSVVVIFDWLPVAFYFQFKLSNQLVLPLDHCLLIATFLITC